MKERIKLVDISEKEVAQLQADEETLHKAFQVQPEGRRPDDP